MVIKLECEEIEKEIINQTTNPRPIIEDTRFYKMFIKIPFDDQVPNKPVYKEIEVISENNNFYIKVNPFLERAQ